MFQDFIFWVVVDYCRFVKGYTYKKLIEGFGWKIPNLNKANLSTHFNKHIGLHEFEMLRDLEKAEPERQIDFLRFMHEFRRKWLA